MPRRTFSDKQLSQIDVVILCGGLGTRLRKVVNDHPKSIANINNRPFLDILINYILHYGFERIILCVGYMAEIIKEYCRKKYSSKHIIFSREYASLGTAGAVKNAERFIKSNPFLVMNGDSFCSVNLSRFFYFHSKKRAFLSMVVVNGKDNKDGGGVVLDKLQKVMWFREKCKEEKTYINAGIYLFQKSVLSSIPYKTKYSLEYNLFPKFVGKEFYGYLSRGRFIDIGTPLRYKQAKRLLEKWC